MDGLPRRFNVPVPTTGERVVITRYTVANALKVSGANLPQGPGRERFERTCSRCHELADPRQHTPGDWVAVVTRMSQHMEQMVGQPLDAQELQQIVLYLEGASKATRRP
ncbi:MAG: cytochrome c [Gemmatimonadetes bacterium]|nr:cytochrome c [Gemmatimonadota bacterium]